MKEIFLQISNRQDLSQDQVQAVFDRILKNEVSESQIASFLMGLKIKGETSDEITGIVRALKSHATVLPETFTDAMCNCGTGGDQSYSFNISTTACFVLAAGGIRMAKAGNRSISSKSGSADVLEVLGINVAASPEILSKALDEVGLAFIFAQTMHPAMRFIGPARQALGIPTIMNLVGPLANPLDLETQLMGSIVWSCKRLLLMLFNSWEENVRLLSQVLTIWTKLLSMVLTPTLFWKMVTSASTPLLMKIWVWKRLSCLISQVVMPRKMQRFSLVS